MSFRGKKLGILFSTAPETPSFQHGLRLAETAVGEGVLVYVYCIDDGVRAIGDPRLQALRAGGLVLYACAYGARQRRLPLTEEAIFAGLGVLSDVIAGVDRFVSFN